MGLRSGLLTTQVFGELQRGLNMAHDLGNKDIERAKFAFDIYDFEGKGRIDLFYLGDCLRGLNLNPTLEMIAELGGTTKKGDKFMKLGELEHILLSLGEKLEREEVDILIKECCDPEDDDGFIPYEPFLRRVCAGPHPEMYEDW